MAKQSIFTMMRKAFVGIVAALMLTALAPTIARAEYKAWDAYEVRVAKGYLALRSEPATDESNEKGELHTGEVVYVKDKTSSGQFWKVYSPKYREDGWVNKDYLRLARAIRYKVRVAKGYLALRSHPSYDESNEEGELYTGDVVEVINRYNDEYWWVSSPKLGKSGYVNRSYLEPV